MQQIGKRLLRKYRGRGAAVPHAINPRFGSPGPLSGEWVRNGQPETDNGSVRFAMSRSDSLFTSHFMQVPSTHVSPVKRSRLTLINR